MARIKLAYLGGGSTRAAGTMASFIWHGKNFNGSEVVLIDLDEDRLALIKTLAERMAAHAGLDITFTTTTDRRAGLTDIDTLLSSFRPGGFEARSLDERIPLKHNIIGQETQGPGGFFMGLRSMAVLKDVCTELSEVAPNARIFNYTNPVNIVAQAITEHTDIPIVSLCEGPIVFPRTVAEAAGLDPDKISAVMAGVNHNCFSVEATYDGQDAVKLITEIWNERKDDPTLDHHHARLLHMTAALQSIPSYYFQYYYFKDEVVREMQAASTVRSEDILSWVPDYWVHYREQAESDNPVLDPKRSRGGIHELELAFDAMDAFYNNTGDILPINLPNTGGVLPGFDEKAVVEIQCKVDSDGFHPLPQKPLPHAVRGLVQSLAEYQILAAKAAWDGTRADGIRALAANPLVPSLPVAEQVYDELAYWHRAYLPERLLH